jgi:phospholipase/carboxylesterase
LAGLSGEWIQLLGTDAGHFRFFFPAAPYSLAELGMPDGRAWWPINMAQLAEAMGTQQFDDLFEHQPPGLPEAREMLCETVREIQREMAGPDTPLVLGGFSQGAMLTMDLSLRGKIEPPKMLLLFSGMLICRPQWQAALSRLSGTYVYQSHGTVDPVLPFAGAESLHELLHRAGIDAQFHSFVGPHTIDYEAVAATAAMMKQLVES